MLAMVVNDDDGNLIPPVLSGASSERRPELAHPYRS